jgi:hypothetical protein
MISSGILVERPVPTWPTFFGKEVSSFQVANFRVRGKSFAAAQRPHMRLLQQLESLNVWSTILTNPVNKMVRTMPLSFPAS